MILSPDAAGQVNWSIRQITDHLPSLPVDIVPVSWEPVFNFKEPQTSKYALLDFMEPHSPNEEYNKFWAWVIQNPPILTFKRELKLADAGPVRLPIEFAARFPIPEPDSKEAFEKRRLEVLYWWGYSHQLRPLLHAEIFKGMATSGINVLSDWSHYPQGLNGSHNWLSVHTPHYSRKPMEEIIEIQKDAKITVMLWGNGQKSFRSAECVGSIMALPGDELSWSYPWEHQKNCVRLPNAADNPQWTFREIQWALEYENLYDIYAECQRNLRNYYAPTYAREYVAKEIEKVL